MSNRVRNKDDVVQYCVRLNLTNPEHLEIHKVLQNINKEVHKSQNNFIVEAIRQSINKQSPVQLMTEDAIKSKLGMELITQKDLEYWAKTIETNVLKEVMAYVCTTLSKFQVDTPRQMVVPVQNEVAKEEEKAEPVDETLAELAGLWSD